MNQILEQIEVDLLVPTHNQPRSLYDSKNLEELAQSVKNHGIIQPLVVTSNDHNIYHIIVGERRWRAAKIAGLSTVPCLIRDIKEHERLEMAIIENIQREAMSALDEAYSYKRLIEEYDYTHEIIGQKLGKSRSFITNALRILELPKNIIEDLKSNKITTAHARVLCGIENPKTQQDIYSTIINKKLSVRDTENIVRSQLNKKHRKKNTQSVSPDLDYMCELLKNRFGTSVNIIGNSKKGIIKFAYYSMTDLQRFLDSALKNDIDKA